jgi:catechol 2,3-dioxygenase-like lactoylglutathione lyase family enzyme
MNPEESRMESGAAFVRVTGLDHVSITTADLDASIGFYADLLGLRVLDRGESESYEIAVMIDLERARIRWADVDVGDGVVLELLQFLHPTGAPHNTSPWDPGATHIGLQVDDIDAMHARLREARVRVISNPVCLTEKGSWHGAKVLYAVDPDGTWIELVERAEPVSVSNEAAGEALRAGVDQDP